MSMQQIEQLPPDTTSIIAWQKLESSVTDEMPSVNTNPQTIESHIINVNITDHQTNGMKATAKTIASKIVEKTMVYGSTQPGYYIIM